MISVWLQNSQSSCSTKEQLVSSLLIIFPKSTHALSVHISLLIQVAFRDIENLIILCNCNPPKLDGNSSISFRYFARLPLQRKSNIIASKLSIYC